MTSEEQRIVDIQRRLEIAEKAGEALDAQRSSGKFTIEEDNAIYQAYERALDAVLRLDDLKFLLAALRTREAETWEQAIKAARETWESGNASSLPKLIAGLRAAQPQELTT